MNLKTGRDIRAERHRRGMMRGLPMAWLAKRAGIPIGELRAIENQNLPLSPEVAGKVREALESVPLLNHTQAA